MKRFVLAAILLLGAVAALAGIGCQPMYPYYPNPYPTRPGWCQPGYECTPNAANPGVYPPSQTNPNTGWHPSSDGYHWIWRDKGGLHIQFSANTFIMIKDAKSGGGQQEVSINNWDKKLKSDRVGWGIGDGPVLIREEAYATRFGVLAPDSMVEGERFNIAFSSPNLILWLNSRMTKTGPGIRRQGNADGSEAFVVDSTKTSIDL
ncbi:MAG: hypothetical protein AAB400_00285 [Patescibacteria group bacterium]